MQQRQQQLAGNRHYSIIKESDSSMCLSSKAEPITSCLPKNDSSTNTIESLKKVLNKNVALLKYEEK